MIINAPDSMTTGEEATITTEVIGAIGHSFVGLGVVVTSFTKDQETGMMVMMTLVFPMMFLSGVFFPIDQMPWYMQSISRFLPLTYAATALRKVMVLGAGIPMITTELAVLIGFGVVMTTIAVPVFKKAMTK